VQILNINVVSILFTIDTGDIATRLKSFTDLGLEVAVSRSQAPVPDDLD
jgi:hypothetical protein